jgi:hypothetical protein
VAVLEIDGLIRRGATVIDRIRSGIIIDGQPADGRAVRNDVADASFGDCLIGTIASGYGIATTAVVDDLPRTTPASPKPGNQ